MSVTTYSMLSPPNPAFRTDCPRGGILLNASRPTSQLAHPHSPHRPYIAPSSPSSSSSSDDSVNRKSSPTRRITFAPLPKPRAQELADQQLPVIVLDGTSDSVPFDRTDSLVSYSGDDSNAAQGLNSSANSSPVLGAKKSSSWGYSTKKLFRPFYKPLQKAATLDVDGGGALGLFRATSRESNSSTGTLTDSGAPLARRMSTGSTPYHLGPNNHVVADQNTGLALTPVISEGGGSVAAGTRMLNGRVYGRSRVRATQSEDREPEFVEWGYGGMGSNRGSSASSAYAKVQSGHTNVVAEDDDDGSGMGWVRKRREAREREKREREEKEAKEKAEQEQHAGPSSPASAEDATTTESPIDATDESAPAAVLPEHITQTVAIPARPQPTHHHSKPSHSRRSSDSRHPASGTVTPVPSTSGRSTPMVSRPSTDSTHTVTSAGTAGPSSLRNPIKVASSSSSSSSQSDEDDDTEETTERDEDALECDDDVDEDDDVSFRVD